MLDPSSVPELIAWGTGSLGGAGALILAAQQLWRRIAKTNSNIKVDTEVSSGTIEIIKLLRDQNAAAVVAANATASQYETLINTNAIRYKELLTTNDALYDTINSLQHKLNELHSKIGEYQADNVSLKREIQALHLNNTELSGQVHKLTTEIHNLRRGIS
jgi:chromosome segregation ATPase